MIVIGFDCAQKCGWCVLDQNGKVMESGMQDFTKRRGESNGLLFLRFRTWIKELVTQLPELPGILSYESAHMRGGAATEICVGMQTRVQEMAAEFGIESAPVHTATLKKRITGHGKASKEDMIAHASKVLGRPPVDDNEADAVHVARVCFMDYAA